MGMYKGVIVRCDHCGGQLHTCQPTEKEAKKYAKENGWVAASLSKVFWLCGGCAKKLDWNIGKSYQ